MVEEKNTNHILNFLKEEKDKDPQRKIKEKTPKKQNQKLNGKKERKQI